MTGKQTFLIGRALILQRDQESRKKTQVVFVCAGMLPREPGGWGRGTQRFQHVYVHTATACPVKLAGTSPNFGGV